MASEAPYPLYGTTFTLQSVSPLHAGGNDPIDNATLQQHAQSFQNLLAGDVVRGVRVGLEGSENEELSKVGALQHVTWRLLPEEEFWDAYEAGFETISQPPSSYDMLLTVTYELKIFTAIILRVRQDEEDDVSMVEADEQETGFESFPLLLTRMPNSLRETFLQFLGETLDSRVSRMYLPQPRLIAAVEGFMSDCSGDATTLKRIVKDVQVVYQIESASLDSVQVTIDREDLSRIIIHGKTIEKDR